MTSAALDDTASGGGPSNGATWHEAIERLRRNRMAVGSIVVLALVALACIIGPNLTGHPFDRVYQDYLRAPASLALHPTPEEARSRLGRIAKRLRAGVEDVETDVTRACFTLVSERPLQPRYLALFERSDTFQAARILQSSDDGRRLVVEAPFERHRFLFGTDQNGRDLFTRTLVAGRISLAIGLLAAFVALLIGVTYGAISGYLGGRADEVMMRVVDVLYSLPFIFFVILLVVFFGQSIFLMFVAVGAIEWLDMARIVRGQTLSLRQREYVVAAEALGVGHGGILARHIVPNLLGPVVVYMTLLVPKVILLESFLSFLGLGVQEPMASWGVLIADGARNMEGAAWLLVFPAGFLVATLLALNFLGDGLRDALDPRDR
jgi:oligopeptide transport system permease protein